MIIVILVLWLLLSIICCVSMALAAIHMTSLWRHSGGLFIIVHFITSSIYNAGIAVVAILSIIRYDGRDISVGAIIFTVLQFQWTIPAMALAAYSLGIIGRRDNRNE